MTETITMAYQPKVLCSTAGMTENDWLAWRKTGIGGSEAGIILGSNPYRTKRELFYEKTGVEPVNEKETSTMEIKFLIKKFNDPKFLKYDVVQANNQA